MSNGKTRVLVISLDTPLPDNYGGARDVWAHTKVLLDAQCRVDLVATFRERRRKDEFLNSTEISAFEHVLLVERATLWRAWFSLCPYEVLSRRMGKAEVEQAKKTLGGGAYDAVVVEGFQSNMTFEALLPWISCRKRLLRVQNVENEFFRNLYRTERHPLKKLYYLIESKKYERYLNALDLRRSYDRVLAISQSEMVHPLFQAVPTVFVPPLVEVTPDAATDFLHRKNRLLYVGNLDLPDNRSAIKKSYLFFKDVVKQLDAEYVICGRCKGAPDFAEMERDPHVVIKPNIDGRELSGLYETSKIFVNYSDNGSGVKLKFFDALSHGLPVISNTEGCAGSGLEHLVVNTDDTDRRHVEEIVKGLLEDGDIWRRRQTAMLEAFRSFIEDHKARFIGIVKD